MQYIFRKPSQAKAHLWESGKRASLEGSFGRHARSIPYCPEPFKLVDSGRHGATARGHERGDPFRDVH